MGQTAAGGWLSAECELTAQMAALRTAFYSAVATAAAESAQARKPWTGPDGDNPKPFLLRHQKMIGPFMAM